MSDRPLSRRDFVADGAKLAAGAVIVPRHVLGAFAGHGIGRRAPSDTLNVAFVGCGGMGMSNAAALVSENIVALCDVDFAYVDRQLRRRLEPDKDGKVDPRAVALQEKFAKAARYADFRQMLDKQKDIEGVLIATPDHAHAVIAKAAMELGKHVYVQKPLTWSVHEARVLSQTATRTRVVTQMGNQGHSGAGARLINEWVQAGIIGPVRQVYVWTNRPIWPQGIPRPAVPEVAELASGTGSTRVVDRGLSWNQRRVNETLAAAMGSAAVAPPPTLHWDLYLGPVANDVPYHPIYHPFNWRGWLDFGVGALGDMGAHLIDHPFWALDLSYPTSIEATSTPLGGPRDDPVSYPQAMTVHYEFAARGAQPPVRLSWYDGGLMPPRPDALPDDVPLNREGGVIFVGEKGILMHETYGDNPRIWPGALMQRAAAVPQRYQRIPWSHEMNWAMACKGETPASSPIEYAAKLTETMILGIVALRTGQGKKILYDGAAMQVTNAPEANQYLTRAYRPGWSV